MHDVSDDIVYWVRGEVDEDRNLYQRLELEGGLEPHALVGRRRAASVDAGLLPTTHSLRLIQQRSALQTTRLGLERIKDSQTDRQSGRQSDRQKHRQTHRQKDRQTDTHRQAERQT